MKGHHKHGGKHHKHKDGKCKGNLQAYQCESDAAVMAHQLPKKDKALLKVNTPSWNLNDTRLEMIAATAGLGERFVNETNPTSKYEWHQKGDMGVLSVTINDKIHSLNCEKTEFPLQPHGKHPKKTYPNRRLNLPIKHLNWHQSPNKQKTQNHCVFCLF
ncbi:MliC family protein [Moraxella ovis]|nr:MliC family protein [Moraxella ovis]